MKLLFIKLRHIGDSLLLTPALLAAREQLNHPEIWVVTRRGSDGILAGCPAIDRVLTTASAEKKHRSWKSLLQDTRLVKQIRAQQFDFAFELSESERGRWLLTLSGAKHQTAHFTSRPLGAFWKRRFSAIQDFSGYLGHAVTKDFRVVQSALPIAPPIPSLCFARDSAEPAPFEAQLKSFVVIHPGTRWQRKRWPAGKWIETGRYLLRENDQIVISSGKDPEEAALAKAIAEALGPRAINAAGRLNWRQVASLLYRARLLVSVDTAITHLAAACQCPSVVIWGPSFEGHWRPWQAPHRLVLPPGFQEITRTSGDVSEFQKRKAADVEVSNVIGAIDDLLAARA